nr:M1 family metallopeptidase [Nocardioides thalensis]
MSYAGESNWLADRTEVVTMNEPHMAPWWFPSNDHPRDKATFDIRVTTDADKDVISNGKRVSRVVDGGLATTHWRLAQPTTTYLAYFAAGDFAVSTGRTGGIPWVTAVSKRLPDGSRGYIKRTVNRSGPVTVWLEEHLGDYPFDSTGGLVTDLSSGFALENTTRPTYSGGIGTAVLVHELAHQWFGDSVAIHRWRDIWLNEGFATYMEAVYYAEHGDESIPRWLERNYRETKRWGSFWRVDLTDPGPRRIFAWAVYQRGAMALAALRGKLGGRPFDRMLRTWATEKRHSTARVGEFIALAEDVAGHGLDRFFRVWLKAPRPPKPTERNGF